MKKKLITLILCGVIGGISVAGVANYNMSQGTEETQTLVNALDSADKKENKNEKENEKIDKNNIETDSKKLDKGTSAKESVQANQNSKEDTKVEEDKVLDSSNHGKKVQSSSGQGVVTTPPSQSESNNSTNNNSWEATINNGSNSNGNNQGSSDGGNSNSGSSNGGTVNGGNSNSGSSSGGNSNGGSTNTPAEDTTTGNFYDQVEQLIFNKVNEERAKAGVPALSYNSTMETYARIKSKDMGVRNYFDHVNPEGELITAQMARDGVSYNAWGENIAYIGGVSDPTELANQFMTNWMNSQGHRENILSTNFTSIGVGVYKSGNKYYATQEFCK